MDSFENLPIEFDDIVRDGSWYKHIKRTGTLSELLETWDIDDPNEMSEIAQVLRHLRKIMSKKSAKDLVKEYSLRLESHTPLEGLIGN